MSVFGAIGGTDFFWQSRERGCFVAWIWGLESCKQTFDFMNLGASMPMARRHHSARDIEAKLHQADEMAARGNTQKEISEALGISVMTYHRWRRLRVEHQSDDNTPTISSVVPPTFPQSERLPTLELENERLRRLVADLLLEKMGLQEQLEGRPPTPRRREP